MVVDQAFKIWSHYQKSYKYEVFVLTLVGLWIWKAWFSAMPKSFHPTKRLNPLPVTVFSMTIISFSSLIFGYTQELSIGPPSLSFSSFKLASTDSFKSTGLKGFLLMPFFQVDYSQRIATKAVKLSLRFDPKRSKPSTNYRLLRPLLTV